uniref:RagB/SusD family nutrient uptake outer membrane protein n=1 Tax=Phocaeicola sp. TaxID=2773926 RepID=UPI003FEF6748
MKKAYYPILFLLLALCSACNDWLDVNPRSQIKGEELYKSEDGFKKALNGVYINIAKEGLYGRQTTMYFTDALARLWKDPSLNTDVLYAINRFDYTHQNVEPLVSSIFLTYYNSIAQLNDLLKNLDERTDVTFRYNNDKLLRGEALGLRAFLHLDVLRMFGPMPQTATDGTLAVPYVTEITNETSKLVSKTWGEVFTLMEKDLLDAKALLEEYDPVVTATMRQLEDTYYIGTEGMPEDEWQYFRHGRFNYYAVLGTLARMYHWKGDKEQAAAYARQVIESEKFPLATEETLSQSGSDLVMYDEHLFDIDNPDLQDIVEPLFATQTASLNQDEGALDVAYESDVHNSDIRYRNRRYWETVTYQQSVITHFRKYTGNNTNASSNRVPLLRSVEMYFILMEDAPIAELQTWLDPYIVARSLTRTAIEGTLTTESEIVAFLEKEYRKEFYGEGQLFYFYKPHGYTAYTSPSSYTLPQNALVVPKPDGLTDFE